MINQNKRITGSIHEKNGKYHMVFNFIDTEGKRKQKWESTGLTIRGNKKIAQRMLEDKLKQLNESTDKTADFYQRKKTLLFCDFIIEWLNIQKQRVEENTMCSNSITVNIHLYPYFKDKNILLADVTARTINEYYDAKRKGYGGRKKLSETSLQRHHATISSILTMAVEEGFLTRKAISGIVKPKSDTKKIRVYNEAQIQDLIDILVSSNSKILLPVMLACYFSLRREEISGLKEENIDFFNHRMYIEGSVSSGYLYNEETDSYKTTQFHKNKLKSEHSRRTFVLFPEIEEYLKEAIETKRMYMKLFGNAYNMEYKDYIFVHENGNLITPDYITHTFGKVIKRYNLPHLTFHGLRHSSASLLLSKGFNMKEVQEWLGHGSYDLTARTYAHVYPEAKIEMSNTMAKCFKIDKKEDIEKDLF